MVVWCARSAYTQPIETGGDAIKKWTYVSNFWDSNTKTLANHHTMRWAVNLPGVAFKEVFGDAPAVCYFWPLTAFSIAYVFLCLIASDHLPRRLVVAFAILLFLEPMMHRGSSQFQPIAPGCAYISASFFFAIEWSHRHRAYALLMSVVFLFLAYGAKAPYGYFFPGLLLFVFKEGKLHDIVLAIVAFVFLFSVEVWVFNSISDRVLPLGRLSAILSTHNPETGFNDARYVDYFLMWFRISWFDQLITFVALAPFVYFRAKQRLAEVSPVVVLLCLGLCSYHVLNTFLVVNVETLMTPQPPKEKYLAITMPFALLASFFWVSHFCETWKDDVVARIVFAASFVLLVSHLALGIQPSYGHNSIKYPARNAFIYRVGAHYREGADWLKNGNSVTTNSHEKAEALRVLLRPYLKPDETFLVTPRESEFLLQLPAASRSGKPRVVRYWFSQYEFVPRRISM